MDPSASSSARTMVLRDWLAQRVTAVLMALFTVLVLAQVLFTKGPMGYDNWASIFSAQWMKVIDLLRHHRPALPRMGGHP